MKRPTARLGLAVLVVSSIAHFSAADPARGWTPESQRLIGEQAARLAPPDLYRQLIRNRPAYRVGFQEPFSTAVDEDRFEYPDGHGRLREVIEIAVDHAIASIRAHRPFNDIAYRMGVVAHFLASANNPIHTTYGDPQHQRWAADYLRYAESVIPRVEMVFYGFRHQPDLDRMLDETFARSRSLYPMIGREYQRVDYRSGLQAFDDRSTAYAVAALGYSHAVTDIAEALRYIWLRAGGIDSRPRLPVRGRQLIRLEPLVERQSRAR
ncbi:MAG: hypothetical protein MI919_15390 [Holophagales bacterium]|nr:hypothetical protein [Holophagales bacterium]